MKTLTQEEKQLLRQVLCAMLPYGIKIHIKGEYHKYHEVEEIDISNECVRYFENLHLYEEKITDCHLYLCPMSSMTEEEKEEFAQFHCVNNCPIVINNMLTLDNESRMFDWLNFHHFDYRGLIEKGLALEAPEGMYKII